MGSAGGFGAELAAELDGRVSDLEALVQDLSVLKADQVGLQELRSLLADTATQVQPNMILLECCPCCFSCCFSDASSMQN